MPSLLLKLKSYIAMALIFVALGGLSCGWYWHGQYTKSQAIIAQKVRENATCEVNQDLLESAVQRWKAAADQYDTQLKRKEALVAQESADSQKRIEDIRQTNYSPDCNTAIQQGIQQSQKLGFHWHNNIP